MFSGFGTCSFPHGDLDDGKPFLRVFLVPDVVQIAGAVCIGHLVPHLCNLCKEFYVTLTKFGVWAEY